jgi:copper ion binding protein
MRAEAPNRRRSFEGEFDRTHGQRSETINIMIVPPVSGAGTSGETRRRPMTTETMTVTAPDISCEHCQRAIEGAVGRLSGVQSVHVEIPTKTVQVDFDPGQITRDVIEAALEEEGYPIAS